MTTSSQDKKEKTRKRMQWTGFVTLLSLFSLTISGDYIVRHVGGGLNTFRGLDPDVKVWFAVSLAISAVSGVVSLIDNLAQLKGNIAARFKERIIMMIANSCTGNFVDITALIFFIIYIALIPNCIDNFTEDGSMVWRPLVYIGAVALSVFLKPTIAIDNDDIPREERKVMFSALSNVTYTNNATNLDVFTDPIIKYQGIREVAVLLSDKTFTSFHNLCGGCDDSGAAPIFRKYKDRLQALPPSCRPSEQKSLLETLVREYLIYKDKDSRERYESLTFSFTEQVDFDDFDQCYDAIIQQIEAYRKYGDRDFLFNISPGTKVVSSVMTLNCLKGDRGMIYIRQNPCSPEEKVQEYNPNVFVLDQQFLELTMERMSQEK